MEDWRIPEIVPSTLSTRRQRELQILCINNGADEELALAQGLSQATGMASCIFLGAVP
jgi:hypothetical protein